MCLYTHDYTIRAQSYYFFLDYAIGAPLFTKIYVYRLAGGRGKRRVVLRIEYARFGQLSVRFLGRDGRGAEGSVRVAGSVRKGFEKVSLMLR